MLETLLQALASAWRWLVPWVVLAEYERGVLLRFGRLVREIGPGLTWVRPLGIDSVLSDNVVSATTTLSPQSLSTADGVEVVAVPVLSWRIRDVTKFLMEVEGRETVLSDSAAVIIAEAITAADACAVFAPRFADGLLRDIRKRAFRYGVEVTSVGFQSLARCQSLRLWHDRGEVYE